MIDVVVVTYNSAHCIERCLRHLEAADLGSLIVVDNGSTDGTPDILSGLPVQLIRCVENMGYSSAVNRGVRESQADYVAFVNPDCDVPVSFLGEALELLEHRPRSCVVPRTLTDGRRRVAGRQPGYSAMKLAGDVVASNYVRLGFASFLCALPGFHDHGWYWPHGACMVIGRPDFLELGGFDERFPMYMSDVSFGRRLHDARYDVLETHSEVVHREGDGARIGARQRLTLLNRGRIAYARRYHGSAVAMMLWILAAPGFLLRGLPGVRG